MQSRFFALFALALSLQSLQIAALPTEQPPPSLTAVASDANKPPKMIYVDLCVHHFYVGCQQLLFQQKHCFGPQDLIEAEVGVKTLSSYRVKNGCCAFYASEDCSMSGLMFRANYRSHDAIGPEHNDKLQSIQCFDHCDRE